MRASLLPADVRVVYDHVSYKDEPRQHDYSHGSVEAARVREVCKDDIRPPSSAERHGEVHAIMLQM